MSNYNPQTMKKGLIFIAGIVTGIILLVIISMFVTYTKSPDNGITLHPEAGDCVSENSFKVFQVLDSGDALARELEGSYSIATRMTVLFLSQEGKSFYDDQVIKIPSGQCARQIGTFKYRTKSDMEKTIPVVDIRDK